MQAVRVVDAGTTTIRGAATVTASGATTNQGVRFAGEAGNATIEPVIYIFTPATGETPVGVSPAQYEAWTNPMTTTRWEPRAEFAYAFSQSKVPTVGALGGTENQGITNESASCKVTVDGSRKLTKSVAQGQLRIEVGGYLSTGSQKVKVKIADSYDNSRTITYTVTVVELSMSSAFSMSSGVTSPPACSCVNILIRASSILPIAAKKIVSPLKYIPYS